MTSESLLKDFDIDKLELERVTKKVGDQVRYLDSL